MNITNGYPTSENLSPDAAIRQFCAARVEEQEREGGEWEPWSSSIDFSSDMFTAPQPASSEADEDLVDTFFNVEHNEKENEIIVSDHHPHQLQDDPSLMIDDYDPKIGVDQGLELVHLLLACAEAVGCRDARLAHSILAQIWPRASPWGDSLQRVSQCFAVGLKSRLSLIQNVNPNGTFSTRAIDDDVSFITREEKSEAFTLLHQTTPYIAFGFMAANEAISQAASGKESLHIIDLGMEHVLQWPALIRTLSSRPEGPPRRVRITGIVGISDQNTKDDLESKMRRLCEEAFDLGIVCLEYEVVREQVSPSTLEKLQVREGEVLVVNSMMQLHKHVKESRGSLKAILQAVKKLRPAVVTVVEQDANHNGPFFLGRFVESLHYYSAIFDSLDGCLGRESSERMKIERVHLGEEIRNVVACEGCDRVERHERADQWRRQLGRGGFQVVGMKWLKEVRDMVCGYGCDGYTVGSDKGCLQLGWKGTPIMLASAWHLNN